MRCEACGALNPPDARWCNQCLVRFDTAAPESTSEPVQPEPAPPEAEAPASDATVTPIRPEVADGPPAEIVDLYDNLPTAADASPHAPPAATVSKGEGSQRGPFVVTDGGVVWTCSTCGSTNALDAEICSTCGAPLKATIAPDEEPGVRRDPRVTMFIAAGFPGAGHAYLKQWGQAVARAAIALWALVAVAAGLSLDARGGRPMAFVILLGVAGFWAVAVHDAMREAEGKPKEALLKGRSFLWVVLGLLGLQLVQILLGATSAA